MQQVESREINVSAVHNVDGARLGQQQIENVHVVQFPLGNMDETGNAASQVEQGVHLHGGLGAAEVRPRKHRQTQIDGRGIQGVNGVVEIDPHAVAGIKPPCLSDQLLREL